MFDFFLHFIFTPRFPVVGRTHIQFWFVSVVCHKTLKLIGTTLLLHWLFNDFNGKRRRGGGGEDEDLEQYVFDVFVVFCVFCFCSLYSLAIWTLQFCCTVAKQKSGQRALWGFLFYSFLKWTLHCVEIIFTWRLNWDFRKILFTLSVDCSNVFFNTLI